MHASKYSCLMPIAILANSLAGAVLAPSIGHALAAEPTGKLAEFAGRWVGQGRLGFKEGKFENVTCRATYFISDNKTELKQNIRCASPSGKIEVKSSLIDEGGTLKGEWSEEIYNLHGELTGQVTERGLRVVVQGGDLSANMDVVIKGTKQIVEIQFISSTLLGLTIIFDKG